MGCGLSLDLYDASIETDTRSYIKNSLGIYESFWDFRDTDDRYKRATRPKCDELEVWIDEKFPVIPDAIYLRPQVRKIRIYAWVKILSNSYYTYTLYIYNFLKLYCSDIHV